MDLFDIVQAQMETVKLPLYAVTVSAVAQVNTPLVAILHWHGFRRATPLVLPGVDIPARPVPGSAIQIGAPWHSFEAVDMALLDAAWQPGRVGGGAHRTARLQRDRRVWRGGACLPPCIRRLRGRFADGRASARRRAGSGRTHAFGGAPRLPALAVPPGQGRSASRAGRAGRLAGRRRRPHVALSGGAQPARSWRSGPNRVPVGIRATHPAALKLFVTHSGDTRLLKRVRSASISHSAEHGTAGASREAPACAPVRAAGFPYW